MENSKRGGSRATIFIYFLTVFESIGMFTNMASLVLYLRYVMHFDISAAATRTTNFLGTTFILAVLGGFISDTYMTRLNTALLSGLIAVLGFTLMAIQAHFKKLQPAPCDDSVCIKGDLAVMLYASLCLLGLGYGGLKGSVPALGADQFNQNERQKLATFFNWYLLSSTIGSGIGLTVVIWIATHKGLDKGYILGAVCTFIGTTILASGKSFYRIQVPGESILSRIFQVLVVTVKNRRTQLPINLDELYEIHDEEAVRNGGQVLHTNQFRLLDKAAIIHQGSKPEKWRVCTVTQVEEVKILTRMLPIILSTILLNTCLAQLHTLTVQQGVIMNTKIGSFHIPPASIPIFQPVFLYILIPTYESMFVPVMKRLTGNPDGITYLQRAGVGLVLSALSMSIAGIIEMKRKREFVHHGNRITIFWLSIQYGIFGIADMFTFIGLMDFFYSEGPAGMKSLSTSFAWLLQSMGFFLSTIFVNLANTVTSKMSDNRRGWLEGRDLNTNHLERFYWFLAVLSVLNFANYLYWANWSLTRNKF